MEFLVTDFGAVGDGVTMNTQAIKAAVQACSAAGGGEVRFPNGCFVSGTIELLDGVTLYFDKGAVLKASDNLSDFEKLPLPDCDVGVRIGFIYAIGKRDIGLAGRGKIDLNYTAFFKDDRRLAIDRELTERERAEATLAIPPRLTQPICIHDCVNVDLRDLTIVNSPSWTISMVGCEHVTADRVTIDNSLLVPNCDGIGFSSSYDVVVSNCHISCADDCLTFCGTKQCVVSNCVLRTRSSAIRIGYIEDTTENLAISNIVIHDSNRGIMIQGSRNAKIHNVVIQNVIMRNKGFAGAWWGSGEPLTIVSGSECGGVSNVIMSNVRAESARGIAMRGLASGNVRDILLRDWQLTITAEGECSEQRRVDFRDEEEVVLPVGCMPWCYAENIRNLKMEGMDVSKSGDAAELDITPVIK